MSAVFQWRYFRCTNELLGHRCQQCGSVSGDPLSGNCLKKTSTKPSKTSASRCTLILYAMPTICCVAKIKNHSENVGEKNSVAASVFRVCFQLSRTRAEIANATWNRILARLENEYSSTGFCIRPHAPPEIRNPLPESNPRTSDVSPLAPRFGAEGRGSTTPRDDLRRSHVFAKEITAYLNILHCWIDTSATTAENIIYENSITWIQECCTTTSLTRSQRALSLDADSRFNILLARPGPRNKSGASTIRMMRPRSFI